MTLAEQIAKAKADVAIPATIVDTAAPVVAAPGALAAILNPKPSPAPVTSLIPAGGAAAPLGGGDRLSMVMEALRTATTGGGRTKMPLGTGAFLLKSGKFIITDDGKWRISTFSFLCLIGIKDGSGIVYGTEGYTGPIPGDTYDIALFQDFAPKAVKTTMTKNLNALAACMGWSKEQVKVFQSTPKGLDILFELLKGMMGASMVDCIPTNEPSIFSNQVVIQLTRNTSIVVKKDPVTKQPLYVDDKGTKATSTYFNEYWDKKIPLQDLITMMNDDAKVIEAFGSQEAFQAAFANEKALAEVYNQ